MGFVAFVKVAFKCFDFLAWPLFALGYPLCASIQAIETNSDCQTMKLVTYWVLFSLISLFEHAFVKLLEWVPFWSYIKLVIICWLVIPRFDGAFCIYNRLVRPCLSIDLQILINWFIKQNDFVLKRNDFLAEAERYVKENGPEALEALIANMPSLQSMSHTPYLVVEESRAAAEEGEGLDTRTHLKGKKEELPVVNNESFSISKCQEPSVMQKDIKTVEVTEKKEVIAAKQVNQPEPNLAHIENRTFAPVEIKETTTPVEAGWEHSKIPALHQAACEELEAKNQALKSKVQPASASKKSYLPTEEKCVSSHKITSQGAKTSDPPKEVQEKCASSNGLNGKVNVRHRVKKSDVHKEKQEKKVQGQQVLKNKFVEFKQSKWRCTICNVTCNSEGNMYCHLNGKKHLSHSSG